MGGSWAQVQLFVLPGPLFILKPPRPDLLGIVRPRAYQAFKEIEYTLNSVRRWVFSQDAAADHGHCAHEARVRGRGTLQGLWGQRAGGVARAEPLRVLLRGPTRKGELSQRGAACSKARARQLTLPQLSD